MHAYRVQQAGRSNRRAREFLRKSSILYQYFEPVAPLEYWELCLPERVLLVRDRAVRKLFHTPGVQVVERDDLISLLRFNRELARYTYANYQVYFQDFPRLELLKEVRAFVVDLDRVSPSGVRVLIRKVLPRLKVQPNFLVNSGHGLHVVWLLKESVQAYDWRKDQLRSILEKLQEVLGGKYPWTVDRRPITQSFRLPGFPTKLRGAELDAEAFFVSREPVMIEELEKWFDISPERPIMPHRNSALETSRSPEKQTRRGKVKYLPNARLYNWLVDRVWDEGIEEGHRYLTMCALVVCAWKSRVPLHVVREELELLVLAWNDFTERGRYSHKVRESEIEKALQLYNSKATTVRREVLQEWTGLKMPPRKRNGLTREAHIRKMNFIRGLHKEERAKVARKLREQGYTAAQIARHLGVSQRTVWRYLKV